MMPKLVADTEGKVSTIPVRDRDGYWFMVAAVKHAFVCKGTVERCEAEPLRLVDTFHSDDPAHSSIRCPSQLFEQKPGTDVILLGHAHPPRGQAPTEVEVSLRVGSIHKVVRAFGLRVWKRGGFEGITPGPALPMREPVPLIYELAWGGMDTSDPKKPLGEPRNYVGRGITRNPKSLVDQPATQLELPGKSQTPAAFNPIHRHWQPRASYAGTYDEAWMEARMPLLPVDFDPMFHVSVPPDQWSALPLRSDEPMEVLGATPEGEWKIQLPRFAPGFSSVVAGRRSEHRTHLDTILIDADARRVELTWRAAIPLPRKWERLERVLVFEKQVV